MDPETRVKLSLYRHFAETGWRPTVEDVARRAGMAAPEVRSAFRRLAASRVLVLEADSESIRMAPPFSGIPTQHEVHAAGLRYYANCAWDALGIPAALGRPAQVRSRCEHSMEELVLEVGSRGPAPSSWLFHSLLPAAKWWDDIVFT